MCCHQWNPLPHFPIGCWSSPRWCFGWQYVCIYTYCEPCCLSMHSSVSCLWWSLPTVQLKRQSSTFTFEMTWEQAWIMSMPNFISQAGYLTLFLDKSNLCHQMLHHHFVLGGGSSPELWLFEWNSINLFKVHEIIKPPPIAQSGLFRQLAPPIYNGTTEFVRPLGVLNHYLEKNFYASTDDISGRIMFCGCTYVC